MERKPLGGKAYGHIPHLPGSRMGPGDHHCHAGQARICTERARDRHDLIIVQEKLDGSCVAVLRDGDAILALTRAGYLATTSPYEQHHLWAAWVREQEFVFRAVLGSGERLVGEWLAQAHGTLYDLTGRSPFVPFELMRGPERRTVRELMDRVEGCFATPSVVHSGGPIAVENALASLDCLRTSPSRCMEMAEGLVYRVERKGRLDFLAKYVRPEKVDGRYLPEVSGREPVWNWRPAPRDERTI